MTQLPGHLTTREAPATWKMGESGAVQVAVLFVDLVSSSDVAGVLGLEEYAQYSSSFQRTCVEECRYFFETFRKRARDEQSEHTRIEIVGDELAVFLHSERPHNDVYQLMCLAIALKCAWLAVPINAARVASGRPTFDLAVGIHSGPVWATRASDGFEYRGFAINLAKRLESASREGECFRIFVSDAAFKLLNRRVRNLVFGERRVARLKGVLSPVGVYELVDSFIDPARRLVPEYAKAFCEVARQALATDTFDLWIHSCLQVMKGVERDSVEDEELELCRQVLQIDGRNPVALYYAAQGEIERGNDEIGQLYLEDLTRHWPGVADGWLALGRLHRRTEDLVQARRCVLQARRCGVGVEEEALPEPRS